MTTLRPLIAPQSVDGLPGLTAAQRRRFARHLRLPEIDEAGQRRLLAARVALVGAGGLGSPLALYLAAAGVGTLGVIDDDVVEESNLQRQIAHAHTSEGCLKVDSVAESVHRISPDTVVECHPVRLERANAVEILSRYDLVIDGSDNFATRYLVDEAAARLRIPLVWGAVLAFDGQVSVFWERDIEPGAPESRGPDASAATLAGGGPVDWWPERPGVTYRDLHPEPPKLPVQNCAEAGVLGALCGQVGSLMAIQAVQLICGFGKPLLGSVAVIDALGTNFDTVPVRRTRRAVAPRYMAQTSPREEVGPASLPLNVGAADLAELLAARERGDIAFQLVDIREEHEWQAGVIEGAELIPMNVIAEHPELLDETGPVILTCAAGVRSVALIDYLQVRAPYLRLSHLYVGMQGWPGPRVPAQLS
ncbi:ThiF family adenylyltransferase [Micrococcales bacterium 31B]|nr:ThiF family adenylyltransferase [Micrococcales bacterium 31B]